MFRWARSLFATPRPDPAKVRLDTAQARAQEAAWLAIKAKYDNATTTDENNRHWWMADHLSPKSANNYQVRRQLRIRSRYEVANNPYLFGVVNGNADDLVDTGPTLQVTTDNAGYNREVERAWAEWWQEVGGAEKLRTAKLAKTVDGEGFLVLRTVNDLENPVKLYPCDLEADQVTTPAPKDMSELWVDGLTLHPVTGRPTAYTVLRHHPGDWYFPDLNPLKTDKIPARWVAHWFRKFRPGQVRGVPDTTPSLDLFTELRAFRKATLKAAEIAADFAGVLTQDAGVGAPADPGDDLDTEFEAFKRVPLDRGMFTTLPPGAGLTQVKAEHPQTTYEMFQEKCLGEACRPLHYPLNLALGTSQKFNFSSAKLDHLNYRHSLAVERADCETVVLRKLFREWHSEAVLAGVIPMYDGPDRLPPVEWHWPGFEPLDPEVDARADHDRLAHGTLTLREFWARRGYDWRDVLAQQGEEKKEVERLGLAFGEPVKRTETFTGPAPDAGAPAGGEPAAPPGADAKDPTPAGKAAKKVLAGGDVQATALNGAQVASLVAVCDKLAADQYPGGATKAIIRGAFPAFAEELIDTIVAELEKHTPPAPPKPAPDEEPAGV